MTKSVNNIPTTTPFSLKLRTIADVDNAARFLSATWGRDFSPAPSADGKSKAHMRNVVCNLAGYTNGFTSFTGELDALKVPLPTKSFDLPDDVYLSMNNEMEYLYIGKGTGGLDCTNDHAESLGFDSNDFVEALYADEDVCGDLPADFDESVNEDNLRDKELWRYLAKNYQVRVFKVYVPRLDKYGVTDLCALDVAQDYLREIGLKGWEDESFYDRHQVCDRGDDGPETLVVWLQRITSKQ